VYFHWLLTEGEIKEDPMVRGDKPQVAEEAKPFFTEAELAALLKVTRGPDFEARRDHAIIRVLINTGIRVSGLTDLRFNPCGFQASSRRCANRPLPIASDPRPSRWTLSASALRRLQSPSSLGPVTWLTR
jgi:site-specific recombinase XerD